MSFIVNKLQSGGLMTNYQCSVRCAHCRHNASPERNGGFISEEMTAKILTKLEEFGCNSIHIEGGEPFLFPEELLRTVKQINESKIHLEHIVTNSSWYQNQKDTKNLLKQLQQNGLRRLLLKVGPFQNESIPLKKVQNVAQVAEQLGINSIIWDNEIYPDVAAFDNTKTHTLKKYIKTYGDGYMKKLAECFNVTFAGRSFAAYEKFLEKYSVCDLLLQNNGCHNDFPTETHFHVDLFGNFIFSHTNGVTINIDDLGKEIDPKKYPYLTILLNGGIKSLYKLASTKYDFYPKSTYISKCHLCYDIRSFLVTQKGIDSPDLQPLEFYFEN
ncbi:MAG: radical SAM protein [Salinivirgaceae bacterium]|nr:radical SAM protein [Salinivirgaceae bacterium]